MNSEMANFSADKKNGYFQAGLLKGILAVLLFFMIGNLLFLLVGKLFLYSPWAASVDIAIAEDIFWINGHIPDVVFLGDSRFGEGVKPLTVEKVLADQGGRYSTVNIWIPSAGPEEYQKIVRNLLAHHNPRLIICDINENALNKKSAEGSQNSGSRIWHEIPSYLKSCQDTWEWQTHKLFAVRHYGGIIEQAFYNMVSDLGRVLLHGNTPSDGNLGKSKGYFKNKGRQRLSNLTVHEAVDARIYPTIQVTNEGAQKFKAFLSAVRESNLQMVIVLAPVAPELVAKFPQERYEAFIRFIEETTAAAEIPFVNYYQDSSLPPDAYFDHHHLNDKGAEMFSRKIANEVVSPALRDWEEFKDDIKTKKKGI